MNILIVPPRREFLGIVAAFVQAFAQSVRLDRRNAYRVRAITDEIAANVIEHGCCNNPYCDLLEIRAQSDGVVVRVTVLDGGRPFDMSQVPVPNSLTLAPQLRDIGGLGIYLIQRLSDDFTYQRLNGKNIHTLTIVCATSTTPDQKRAS